MISAANMVLPETLRQYIEETKQKMTEREFIEKQATALGVVITGKLRRSAENESAEVEKCFVDESGKLYMLRHGILTIRDAAGNVYWKVEDE